MPVRKKQDTTSTDSTTTESSSSQQQIQHSFHQQLREHIRETTRVVMEEIMREELTEFLGAEWGKYTMILVALGVDLEGNKEILAMRACAEERKDGWMCVCCKIFVHEKSNRSI